MSAVGARFMTAHSPLPSPGVPADHREDRVLLAAAARLARDLSEPNPVIYWSDLAVTAGISYTAFAGAIALPLGAWTTALVLVSILGFYRGLSFIHELSHLRPGRLKGFRTAWNIMFGIPLLTPSFLYDDAHLVHHSRLNYGTRADPEYLQIGAMKHWQVTLFLIAAGLAPFALLVRFAVLAPASLISPALRHRVLSRWSSLAINHAFRRAIPAGSAAKEWQVLEAAASSWALSICILTAAGLVGLQPLEIGLGICMGVALVNQFRTLVSHIWGNQTGEAITITEQYRDSVNLPHRQALMELLAPVGLRFHALHHLLPSLPYHALKHAHRDLSAELGATSAYQSGNYSGVRAVIARIFARP